MFLEQPSLQMTNVTIFFSLFPEIARVRASLFQINGVRKEPLQLPEPDGETVTLNEKVYVPVKEHPDVSTSLLPNLDASIARKKSKRMLDFRLLRIKAAEKSNTLGN